MSKVASKIQNPLILRYHRLMDAFSKSDDERDFYLSTKEGYILYVDLDKPSEELEPIYEEVEKASEDFVLIPKTTFYEVKKLMEGFVNEKVYDIDTKEKLLDIIASKEARENFLEFIYDHLTEWEKWQQYYQERSRVLVIEWLRTEKIEFVFEEDLDINRSLMEKVKRAQFEAKVPKDISGVREMLRAKAKVYYSNEALNPRPKRGRPPKQSAKVEVEPQFTADIYITVPGFLKRFLYVPGPSSLTFSSKFDPGKLLASLRGSPRSPVNERLEELSAKLESLRTLSQALSSGEKKMGLDSTPLFKPFSSPKFREGTSFQVGTEKEKKVETAVEEIIPKKRGRPKKQEKEEGPFVSQPRNFKVKQVSEINKKK